MLLNKSKSITLVIGLFLLLGVIPLFLPKRPRLKVTFVRYETNAAVVQVANYEDCSIDLVWQPGYISCDELAVPSRTLFRTDPQSTNELHFRAIVSQRLPSELRFAYFLHERSLLDRINSLVGHWIGSYFVKTPPNLLVPLPPMTNQVHRLNGG